MLLTGPISQHTIVVGLVKHHFLLNMTSEYRRNILLTGQNLACLVLDSSMTCP